jgi:CubicO group peptidase (beta-lactamase class C family)
MVEAKPAERGGVLGLERLEQLAQQQRISATAGRPSTASCTRPSRTPSVAKAYSGAVALALVNDGRLGLADTIGGRRWACCRSRTR